MSNGAGVDVGAWQQVVRELQRSEDTDRAYVERMTALLGQMSAARQAVLFAQQPEGAGLQAVYVWPGAGSGAASAVAQREQVTSAATSVLGAHEPRVVRDATGVVLAAPLPERYAASGAAVSGGGVVTLLLDGTSDESLRTLVVLTQLIVGYLGQQVLSRQLRGHEARSEALELGTSLLASVNAAGRFKAAAVQIVNDVCRALGADRVSMGWAIGRSGTQASADVAPAMKIVAISDTEHVDRRQGLVQALEAAMDEACDQQHVVMWPVDDGGEDSVLATRISQAHRMLQRETGIASACTVPLRVGDACFGALTVEGRAGSATMLGALQAVGDLLAPVLRLRKLEDRPFAARAVDSALGMGGWLVGPRQTGWKLAGLGVAAALVALLVIQAPVPVRGDASFEVMGRRVVSAPFEGVVRAVPAGIEAGARVVRGDVLVQLEDGELRLAALEAEAQVREAETRASAALQANDLAVFDRATASAAQARAQLELLRARIAQATIRAPIDGVILAGDVEDRVGGTVGLGEALLEVAPLDAMRVVVLVDDRDMRFVDVGSRGSVARTSDPSVPLAIEVERVVPIAQAAGGVNAFRVLAKLDEAEARRAVLRPGMEGRAAFEGPQRSLFWIGTRRVREAIRLWAWW